jgi:hypothetical protein
MTKIILLIAAFSICFSINNAFCQENKPSPNSGPINIEEADNSESREEKSDSNIWQKIWGVKARDALLLGMWSIHLDGTGEYFGDGRNNDQNHF